MLNNKNNTQQLRIALRIALRIVYFGGEIWPLHGIQRHPLGQTFSQTQMRSGAPGHFAKLVELIEILQIDIYAGNLR